jgi:dTDP-4-amino-4,6-dideoxygalactose transaminase
MSHLAILGGSPVRTAPFARWPEYGDPERAALMEVLESGSWGGYSPKVAQFERAFSAMHGADFAVTASNGTVTLEALSARPASATGTRSSSLPSPSSPLRPP